MRPVTFLRTMESTVLAIPDFSRWHFHHGSVGSASESDSASKVVNERVGDCHIPLAHSLSHHL